MEYDLVVFPGADPAVIRLAVDGADRLGIDEQGNLILSVQGREIIQYAPTIYQEINGAKHEISGGYYLAGDDSVGFQVGTYDTNKPVIIDPILKYSTYLGGTADDVARSIAVDSFGNMYVTGYTASADFPTANALQPSFGGISFWSLGDVFVTKLNSVGNILYSTYLGGSSDDEGRGIAVDANGNVFLTGSTRSPNFPTTLGAFDRICGTDGFCNGSNADVFITKLDASGSALVYSTYMGGSSFEEASGLALDSDGNAYVAGVTFSNDFPMASPFQGVFGGGLNDGFVAKLNATGSALVYSTYLGGSSFDGIADIAVDPAGNAYLAGSTVSSNFPTTSGAPDTTCGNNGTCNDDGFFVGDAFVTKLNAAGSGLAFSTYLGGSGGDFATGVAVDSAGNAFVTGMAGPGDFPTTSGAFQSTGVGNNAFVTRLNTAAPSIEYSTFLSGSGFGSFELGLGITVDSDGKAYIAGVLITSADFPTVNPIQAAHGGGVEDAFVTVVNEDGSALVFSSFLGGDGGDSGNAIAIDAIGNIYVTGRTFSTDFPILNPALPTLAGGSSWGDAFVVKIGETNVPPLADAGLDQNVECTSSAGVSVTLDGTSSGDADGDVLTYAWRDAGNNLIGTSAAVSLTLPLGTHMFTLTVDDGNGGTASDSVGITVQDTTPPTLSFTLSPDVIRSHNHSLVEVAASIQVSDLCDPNPSVVLVSITSNESDDGLGDGDTSNDIQGASVGTDDRSFFLRAERAGAGTGRIYTVTYQTTDATGNMTFATGQVIVPHDQSEP